MTDPILDSAEDIIAAFGGIRPMAKKLGVAVTTIQGWKARGAIPLARLEEIRAAAAREGIDLSASAPIDFGEGTMEEIDAEPVRAKPDAGVRAAGSNPMPPPVIDQPTRRPRDPNRQRQVLILAGCVVAAVLAGAVMTYIWLGAPPPAGGNRDMAKRIERLERRVRRRSRPLGTPPPKPPRPRPAPAS